MAEYAAAYAARGLAVFPLHWVVAAGTALGCSCADSDCRSPAKHPLTVNGVKDASTDAAAVAAWWEAWPQANIGLALGGFVVVDTDPRNGGDIALEMLEAQHGRLPDTWLAITGGGGTHHVYAAAAGAHYPGKLGKGVDLKRGDGAYIVVEPSRHISGNHYAWEASSSPLDGAACAPAPAWMVSAQGLAQAAPVVAVGLIPPQQHLELRSALAFVDGDSRDTWLTVGMALHSTGAQNAFAIWTEWSQLSEKFNAADQRRVWNSFSNKANGVQLQTIFALAQAAGWVNPASAKAQQFDERAEAAIAYCNATPRIEIVEPAQGQAQRDPFPVPILEEAAAWIRRRYGLTHPDVTRQTVLAVTGLAASRVYVGDDGSPAHLCLGVVTESAILSNYVRDAIARLLEDCGCQRMQRGTRANAPSNIYSALFKAPACIHVVNDFGHLAQFAKRQPSGVLDQTFAVMADAYVGSNIYLDSAAEAGLRPQSTDEQLVIHSPALTTVLISTFEQMGALLQRGELCRGLLQYQLPIVAETQERLSGTPTNEGAPAALVDAFRRVRRLEHRPGSYSQAEIYGQQPCSRPNLIRVRFATAFDEYAAAIAGVSDTPAHAPLVLAAQAQAKRIATALGAWADPASPLASREILAWACSYTVAALRAWLERYDTLGNEDGKIDVAQKVIAAIAARRGEGIPRAKLPNFCWAYRAIRDNEKRAKLIDGLLDDGDLVEITKEGERKKTLVAAKFVKKTLVVTA
nr:bifunctional DNA primase/polymerase [Tahibacter harae]